MRTPERPIRSHCSTKIAIRNEPLANFVISVLTP